MRNAGANTGRWSSYALGMTVAFGLCSCGGAQQPAAGGRLEVASADQSTVSFERIADFPRPGWHVPRQPQLSPDGRLVTYLASPSQGADMALHAFDLATRQHRVLLRAADLVDVDQAPSRAEELRRERQRLRLQGISQYAWAESANVLLLPLGGDVFVRRADGSIQRLTDTPEPEIDPQLCATGEQVAFARGQELYTVSVATGQPTQLTSGAPAGVTRGQSDFNAQEEFDEPSGLWWSPRCDRLAYLEVDERTVGSVPLLGYRGGEPDLMLQRYPRSGKTNPAVRLGIVDLAGQTTWVAMPQQTSTPGYVGRLHWNDDGTALFVQLLSRNQRHLTLLRVDPTTGQAAPLATQQHQAWIPFADLRVLPEGAGIVWTVVRGGHHHLERIDAHTGETVSAITAGSWDVSEIAGLDRASQRVWFIANQNAVLDRQLYTAPWTGAGPTTRLTPEPGVHRVAAQRPRYGFVDVHSALDRPPLATVRGPAGKLLGELPVPRDDDFDSLRIRPARLVTVKTAGAPDLHGALLEPRTPRSGSRHPAVFVVYGGPGVQTVRNEFKPRLFWQHLADRGFVVFRLDGRGSPGRGHDFATSLHGRMGDVELEDQLRGLEHLAALPLVDPERIGIFGHSYGGYLAIRAMLLAPKRLAVGVAGAPVTDWALYDTAYTERYLGTPAKHPTRYAQSALAPLAGQLAGKLLIVHSLMDENVHFTHTARFIDALVAADEDFDLLLFPGERHGYRDAAVRRYFYRRVIDYFVDNL